MDEQEQVIKLDGSLGVGTMAHLTIVTKDDTLGSKESTYEVPFALINTANLQKFVQLNFILGYSIVKQPNTGSIPEFGEL